MGLVHRVKNCRSRNVSPGCSFNFEIAKTDLVSIPDELLGDLEEFLELVGHCWVGGGDGRTESLTCEFVWHWQKVAYVLSLPT